MMRQFLLGVSLVGLTVVLSGCGGGGPSPGPTPPGPSPGPGPGPAPAPPPGPCPCPKSYNFVHCSECNSDGSAISCTKCTGDYKPNNAATDRKDPDQVCITKCGDPEPKLGKPEDAMEHNGKTWPTLCLDDKTEAVFFGIGDWGGMCGYGGNLVHCSDPSSTAGDDCTYVYGGEEYAPRGLPCMFPKGAAMPPARAKIEGKVQKTIANRMAERNDALKQAGKPTQYILNVGDNFYPGGVDVHCGSSDVDDHTREQFKYVWRGVYTGDLTDKLEWWSVLGNHDYGGVCYQKGWDQQILYTWEDDKWVMPGQYWKRSVQYKNMKMDFFFVDGSWLDTKDGGGGVAINHNICQFNNLLPSGKPTDGKCAPPADAQCALTGPSSPDNCEDWFKKLWKEQYHWLVYAATASTADWQIVVTHYPAAMNLGHSSLDQINWIEWGPKFGIDIIISGHKHFQRVYKGVICGESADCPLGGISGQTEHWDKGTVSIITGGGGGIINDDINNLPDADGEDDCYGFMEFHATLEKIEITAWSHGGLEGKMVRRNQTTTYPVTKASDDEIIKAGLDPQNLLKKRAGPVPSPSVRTDMKKRAVSV